MSTRCRFCGGKVFADATDCEHCGKVLKKSTSTDEQVRLTNLQSWDRSIPSWLMYAVVGFFLLCLVLMVVKGCDVGRELPTKEGEPVTLKLEGELAGVEFVGA